MARVPTAFLCNYATQESSGLVSAIGAFVDSVYGPTLPMPHIFYLVARIEPSTEEVRGGSVPFALRLVQDSDGETVLEARGSMQIVKDLTAGPDDPPLGQLIVPVPATFQQEGSHQLLLLINEEVVWQVRVTATLLR